MAIAAIAITPTINGYSTPRRFFSGSGFGGLGSGGKSRRGPLRPRDDGRLAGAACRPSRRPSPTRTNSPILGASAAAAAAFGKKVKVLFLGVGPVEGPGTTTFSEQLTQAGIKNIYLESPGTAHAWLTWRRCFQEFASRLFR
jgi:hypothetical protein